MALVFTNTRTRRKETFTPLRDTEVRMYTCGPTVYNTAHIGNFMAYIDADLIQRYLRYWKGYAVRWVMNITDVDDKTIRGSARQFPSDEPLSALNKFTRHFEALFFEDMQSVGIDRSHIAVFPRATEHINEMQDMIRQIRRSGYAYEKGGSVYFDLKKYHDDGKYGELLNVDFAGFKSGVRIDADEYAKDNVQDFVLWKAAKEGEPVWQFDSDGKRLPGRPGWHIECSAMSDTYLGTIFDIHTGGVDLMFPHHENEIAQSTAAHGVRHANVWLHNEHLHVDGSKMAKSKGNFYTLRDIIERGHGPLAFRMVIISAHYRSKLNFTFESITAAQEKIARVNEVINKLQHVTTAGIHAGKLHIDSFTKQFEEALDDDMNTPQAFAVLFEFLREVNSKLDVLTKHDAEEILVVLRRVNGIFAVFSFDRDTLTDGQQQMVDEREQARAAKNFAKADELRERLRKEGVEVEDTENGPLWRRIR